MRVKVREFEPWRETPHGLVITDSSQEGILIVVGFSLQVSLIVLLDWLLKPQAMASHRWVAFAIWGWTVLVILWTMIRTRIVYANPTARHFTIQKGLGPFAQRTTIPFERVQDLRAWRRQIVARTADGETIGIMTGDKKEQVDRLRALL